MIHCITIVDTVIGNFFIFAKHQLIMDFSISSDSLVFGIKHLIKFTCLLAANVQINKVRKIYIDT